MKSTVKIIKSLYIDLLDILFPRVCIGCSVRGENICQNCVLGLKRTDRDSSDDIYSYFAYKDELVKKAVWDLKYHKRSHIGYTLGKILYENFLEEISDIRVYSKGQSILVIPVPLSKNRLKFRGYNQAEKIAKGFCESDESNLFELRTDILTKKDSLPQARIDNRQRRLKNIKNCFDIVKPSDVKGRTIILIDDVTTTGGTLGEIIKILKKSGAKKVVGVTFAH